MNNTDVLRVLVHTNRMNDGVTKGFDLAFDSCSYESLDFLVNYHWNSWCRSSTGKLESFIFDLFSGIRKNGVNSLNSVNLFKIMAKCIQ
jgi:hypothetical protein